MSVTVFDAVTIGLSLEVGSVGVGYNKNGNGFSIKGSSGLGGGLTIEWE